MNLEMFRLGYNLSVANNPNLKRYVGPDDGLLGKNQYNNHWNQDKPGGRQVCVHAIYAGQVLKIPN